jgi:hypothetical protein
MAGSVKVLRGVTIGRIITAPDMAARATETQVNPHTVGLQALLAAERARCHVTDIF